MVSPHLCSRYTHIFQRSLYQYRTHRKTLRSPNQVKKIIALNTAKLCTCNFSFHCLPLLAADQIPRIHGLFELREPAFEGSNSTIHWKSTRSKSSVQFFTVETLQFVVILPEEIVIGPHHSEMLLHARTQHTRGVNFSVLH